MIVPDIIDLTKLPREMYDKLPMTIKSYKDQYKLDELPPPIQYKIKDYYEKQLSVEYTHGFDVKPLISEYGDLATLNTVEETVVEYLKNHFLTLPSEYPFNCAIGSKLKYHLHTKDTSMRQLLITNEVEQILDVIRSDFGANIDFINVKIDRQDMHVSSHYNILIEIKVNNKRVSVGMEILND